MTQLIQGLHGLTRLQPCRSRSAQVSTRLLCAVPAEGTRGRQPGGDTHARQPGGDTHARRQRTLCATSADAANHRGSPAHSGRWAEPASSSSRWAGEMWGWLCVARQRSRRSVEGATFGCLPCRPFGFESKLSCQPAYSILQLYSCTLIPYSSVLSSNFAPKSRL